MLMRQDMFNFLKEGSSVEKIQLLEDKITKVIDKMKVITEENDSLKYKQIFLIVYQSQLSLIALK